MAQPKKPRSSARRSAARGHGVEKLIESFVDRMKAGGAELGHHSVRIQVVGRDAGVWSLEPAEGRFRVAPGPGRREPTIEVIAEAAALRSVLEGGRDGREAFLAGGIRVRGDIDAIARLSEAAGTHVPSSPRPRRRSAR